MLLRWRCSQTWVLLHVTSSSFAGLSQVSRNFIFSFIPVYKRQIQYRSRFVEACTLMLFIIRFPEHTKSLRRLHSRVVTAQFQTNNLDRASAAFYITSRTQNYKHNIEIVFSLRTRIRTPRSKAKQLISFMI